MTVVRRVSAIALLALGVSALPAAAQTPRLEVGVSGMIALDTTVGEVDANLITPGGDNLTLFRTSNRIASRRGVEGLLSFRVRERLRLELTVGWANADFETRISDDFEGVPDIALTQGLNQYSGEAALTYRLLQRGRWSVFGRGGAGVFREITSDRVLVDNGWTASGGAVAQFRLRDAPSGLFGRVAFRAEARAQMRRGGVDMGDVAVSPMFVAGLVIGR